LTTLFRGRVHGVAGADAVLIEDGLITWVGSGSPPRHADDEVIAGPDEWVAPGFIDLQANGFRGHDAAGGSGDIAAMAEGLPPTGVTAFLPTMISAPVEAGADFAGAVATAAAESRGARVLGAHIEGPFINSSFRGAHARECIVEPTAASVEVIARARPRLVTLAPELPGALDAIHRLARAGVVVSAGHTGADFEQGTRAIAAGIRFGTHIYNAMSPVHHRRPGIALALLLDRRVTVGLIADGAHVHAAMCAQLVRVKDPTRIALTTDQTAAAGAPPGTFKLNGRSVVSDGTVVRLEDGTLAGSAATMDGLVRRMAAIPGMNAARAIAMASTVPARVLGERGLGRIRAGACADIVVLDGDLRVRLTMVGGKVSYRR
jgi:N-acetylglucosamine-6-phosphate deacetylase